MLFKAEKKLGATHRGWLHISIINRLLIGYRLLHVIVPDIRGGGASLNEQQTGSVYRLQQLIEV